MLRFVPYIVAGDLKSGLQACALRSLTHRISPALPHEISFIPRALLVRHAITVVYSCRDRDSNSEVASLVARQNFLSSSGVALHVFHRAVGFSWSLEVPVTAATPNGKCSFFLVLSKKLLACKQNSEPESVANISFVEVGDRDFMKSLKNKWLSTKIPWCSRRQKKKSRDVWLCYWKVEVMRTWALLSLLLQRWEKFHSLTSFISRSISECVWPPGTPGPTLPFLLFADHKKGSMWEQEGKQSVGRRETKAFRRRSSHEKVRRRPVGVRKLCSVCLHRHMGVSQHVATSETHAGRMLVYSGCCSLP